MKPYIDSRSAHTHTQNKQTNSERYFIRPKDVKKFDTDQVFDDVPADTEGCSPDGSQKTQDLETVIYDNTGFILCITHVIYWRKNISLSHKSIKRISGFALGGKTVCIINK